MPLPDSLETLTPKLGQALTTLRQVDQVYVRALPPAQRLVYRGCDYLPLGLIPLSLLWSVIILFLPSPDPLRLVLVFAVGMLALLATLGVFFLFRWFTDHARLPDEVLRELVDQDFAYHPNAVLRRALTRRGYVTVGEFRTWAQNQRSILNTRANDYAASIDALRRSADTPALHTLSDAAREFLDDR